VEGRGRFGSLCVHTVTFIFLHFGPPDSSILILALSKTLLIYPTIPLRPTRFVLFLSLLTFFKNYHFNLSRAYLENYTLAWLIDLTLNPFVSCRNCSSVVLHIKYWFSKYFINISDVFYVNSIFQPDWQLYRKLFPIPLFFIPKIMPRITFWYYSLFLKNLGFMVLPSIDSVA